MKIILRCRFLTIFQEPESLPVQAALHGHDPAEAGDMQGTPLLRTGSPHNLHDLRKVLITDNIRSGFYDAAFVGGYLCQCVSQILCMFQSYVRNDSSLRGINNIS